ncbi:MAG: hypothetical protein IKJ01_02340 [Lachnospiraceae bacterium]|nr:hypothetical protein [Lachnospiraceae bacterium]
MIKVVGIRFQKAGKIYYFDPGDFELETGMHTIVETARGVEMGTVLIPPKEVEDDKVIQPLKPVLRVATDEDECIVERNKEKEKEAFAICKEKIIKHGLEMKLVNAEYTFDNNKLLFYFTADGRIDFRELVKDLAAVFRTRIELRQIGVRDETKILGGIGICGRPLCCKTYLSDFVPVSIKMAKEQNLSLNPTKISGVCGRLMCCLKNEQETYEYLNSRLPSVGDVVTTRDGVKGEVQSVSVLRQIVKVIIDTGEEKELREYRVEDISFRPKKRKDIKLTEEELKELERLKSLEDDIIVEERMTDKGRERNYDKPRTKSHERVREKSYDKFSEKPYDKFTEKSSEKSYGKSFDKANRGERKKRSDVSRKWEKARDENVTNELQEDDFSRRYEEEEQLIESYQEKPYKKRYEGNGKGKRYFGKNKKRKDTPT